MAERISLKQFYRCGDRDSIILKVSTKHPNIICQLFQVQYPASSFFRDKTSFRFYMSWEYRGCNTLSSVWDKVRQTWHRLWEDP